MLTQAPVRTCTLYTISNTNSAYKQGLMREGDSSAKGENTAGLLFWKKKCFKIGLERVQRGFLSERKGKVIPCRGFKDKRKREQKYKQSGD